MDVEGWGAVFKTNVVAPALLAQVYLPLIERSTKKTIINVSSSLGAFGYGYGELWASYAITKTGLNMLVCSFMLQGLVQHVYKLVATYTDVQAARGAA